MKENKTTYWLIFGIGVASLGFAIYLFFKGRPFDTYFFGGFIGVIFTVLGIYELRKPLKNEN